MKSLRELAMCDRALLAVSVLILASGIQLEGWWLGMEFLWFHIVIGVMFFLLIGLHMALHFGKKGWFGRMMRHKSRWMKWLALSAALALLSGIAATIHMFFTWQHSSLGVWHGKIGYIFVAIVAAHIWGKIRLFRI